MCEGLPHIWAHLDMTQSACTQPSAQPPAQVLHRARLPISNSNVAGEEATSKHPARMCHRERENKCHLYARETADFNNRKNKTETRLKKYLFEKG